jgi:hypothetical protein
MKRRTKILLSAVLAITMVATMFIGPISGFASKREWSALSFALNVNIAGKDTKYVPKFDNINNVYKLDVYTNLTSLSTSLVSNPSLDVKYQLNKKAGTGNATISSAGKVVDGKLAVGDVYAGKVYASSIADGFNVEVTVKPELIVAKSTEITLIKPVGFSANINWASSDPYVAYVNKTGNDFDNQTGISYNDKATGKILAVAEGTCEITATDATDAKITHKYTVKVVNDPRLATTVQKVIYYYTTNDSSKFPAGLADATLTETGMPIAPPKGYTFPSKQYAGYITTANSLEGNTNPAYWMVSQDRTSITLYDPTYTHAQDRIQYIQGGRYLPKKLDGNTTDTIAAVMSDGKRGIWVLGTEGAATHIARVDMNLDAKTMLINEVSKTYADRYGFQPGNNKFADYSSIISAVMNSEDATSLAITDPFAKYDDDNDGLWTTMYAAGEIWSYQYLKEKYGPKDNRTIDAKKSAEHAVKAILMLSYISGEQLKVPKDDNYDTSGYVQNLLGLNANGTFKAIPNGVNAKVGDSAQGYPIYLDKAGNYTLSPKNADGTVNQPAPAGFTSRTYKVVGSSNGSGTKETAPTDSPWMHKGVGSVQDVNGTHVKFSESIGKDWNGTAQPILRAYDTVNIPTLLAKEFPLTVNASSDIYYKASTSADEMVGHYFLFDVAFRAFKETDPELGSLIKATVINGFNAMIINNYYMVTCNTDLAGNTNLYSESQNKKIGTVADIYAANYAAHGNALNFPSIPTKHGVYNPEYLTGVVGPWGYNIHGPQQWPINSDIALQMITVGQEVKNATRVSKDIAGVQIPKPLNYDYQYKVMTNSKVNNTSGKTLFQATYPRAHTSKTILDMIDMYLPGYFKFVMNEEAGLGDDKNSTVKEMMNYSTEEMMALSLYTLSNLVPKTEANRVYEALNQVYYNERPEKNAFLTYFYAASVGALKNKGVDVSNALAATGDAAWSLERMPINTVEWDVDDYNRQDVTLMATNQLAKGQTIPNKLFDQVLPRDEVRMRKYNSNPYDHVNAHGFNAGIESGTIMSLPYWISKDPGNAALINKSPQVKETDTPTATINAKKLPAGDGHSAVTVDENGVGHVTLEVGQSITLEVDESNVPLMTNIMWITDTWRTGDSKVSVMEDYFSDPNFRYYGAKITGLQMGTTRVYAMTSAIQYGSKPQTVEFDVTVIDPHCPTYLDQYINPGVNNNALGTADTTPVTIDVKKADQMNVLYALANQNMASMPVDVLRAISNFGDTQLKDGTPFIAVMGGQGITTGGTGTVSFNNYLEGHPEGTLTVDKGVTDCTLVVAFVSEETSLRNAAFADFNPIPIFTGGNIVRYTVNVHFVNNN